MNNIHLYFYVADANVLGDSRRKWGGIRCPRDWRIVKLDHGIIVPAAISVTLLLYDCLNGKKENIHIYNIHIWEMNGASIVIYSMQIKYFGRKILYFWRKYFYNCKSLISCIFYIFVQILSPNLVVISS